jgi:hypothetical protein
VCVYARRESTSTANLASGGARKYFHLSAFRRPRSGGYTNIIIINFTRQVVKAWEAQRPDPWLGIVVVYDSTLCIQITVAITRGIIWESAQKGSSPAGRENAAQKLGVHNVRSVGLIPKRHYRRGAHTTCRKVKSWSLEQQHALLYIRFQSKRDALREESWKFCINWGQKFHILNNSTHASVTWRSWKVKRVLAQFGFLRVNLWRVWNL